MKSWVLGYSYQAEVLKLEKMREEIKRELEQMICNYSNKHPNNLIDE